MSLGVILITRKSVGEEAFGAWGWRVPFLISILLVGLSLWIRYSLRESPMYDKLKKSGGISKNPLKESFGNPYNLSYVLLALFGATMGQGVVWYTGQFYALFYLQKIYGVDLVNSNLIIGGALLFATPFFVVFGHLSDKIGRKQIILWGMILAVVTWLPIYRAMEGFAPFINFNAAKDAVNTPNPAYSPFMLGLFVFIQVIYVTMVYGPIAAYLVELFPTKIRYTSMSLPYHIGNGVFGGLVPIIGLSMLEAAKPGSESWMAPIAAPFGHYAGLVWPMLIAAICAVVCFLKMPETYKVDISSDASVASIGTGKVTSGD
jgi:MFS family permease